MRDVRTEHKAQALIVRSDEPESDAEWVDWGHPRIFDDLDSELAQHRLRFLDDCKRLAHSDKPQPPNRILDYRVLTRTVTASDWRPADLASAGLDDA